MPKAAQLICGRDGEAGQACQTESRVPLHSVCLRREGLSFPIPPPPLLLPISSSSDPAPRVPEVLSQPFRGEAELSCH